MLRHVILEILRVHASVGFTIFSGLHELLRAEHARDLAVSTLLTHNLDIDIVLALGDLQIGLLEAEGTREVLIENSDKSLSIITRKSRLTSNRVIVQLNEELHVRLPLGVVNDGNLNFRVDIALLHVDNFVVGLVLDASSGSLVFSAHTERFLDGRVLLGNGDLDGTGGLRDSVVHALEANLGVLMTDFHCAREVLNLVLLTLDIDEVMIGIETAIFARGKSLEQRLFLEHIVHFVGAGLGEFSDFKRSTEQVLDARLILVDLAGVRRRLIGRIGRNIDDELAAFGGVAITVLTSQGSESQLRILLLLLLLAHELVDLGLVALTDLIDTEGHKQENDEEGERDPRLSDVNLAGTIEREAHEEPKVGEQGPGGSDREHGEVLHFLAINILDGDNGKRRNNEQVECSGADDGRGTDFARRLTETSDGIDD